MVDTATGCGDAVASSGSQSCKSGEEKKEDVLPATSMGATVPGGVRRKVLVVRRGQGLRWAAAGSGWTRLMYPGTDDGPVWLPSAHKRSEVESGVVDRTAWVNRYVSIRSTDTRTTIYTLPSFHFLALHEFCESGEPGYRGKKKTRWEPPKQCRSNGPAPKTIRTFFES